MTWTSSWVPDDQPDLTGMEVYDLVIRVAAIDRMTADRMCFEAELGLLHRRCVMSSTVKPVDHD